MGLTAYVSILNRLVEQGVSLKKAYYACFGDNMEKHIIVQLYQESNTSRKLEKLLFREYSRFTKEENQTTLV
mgnify:CR=1 FL=1